MLTEVAAEITGILERAVREQGFTAAVVFDGDGALVATAGDGGELPPAAQALWTHDAFRRVARTLDDDEPELAPDPATGGGALFYFARAERYVVGVVALSDDPAGFGRRADAAASRVDRFLDGRRQERRKRFLGHRLIARVCDKTYVMSAEVRTHLEHLCDLLLDLEEAQRADRPTASLGRQFHESLQELVAWPKKAGGSFQHNLEILLDSVSELDLRHEVSEERLRAIVAGLEVSIESWPLP